MAPPVESLRTGFGADHERSALLALLVLSPGIAEGLTGSTPFVLLLLHPLQLVISVAGLVALYGGGVLLIREARVRWKKGWGSVLLLGAAYGIVEEGFAVHTFFRPVGSSMGAVGVFGHWLGVDWLWAVGLTIFHSIYSIALPILLVDLYYPEVRTRPLLTGRGLIGTGAAYLAVVGLYAAVTPDAPSVELGLGAAAMVLLLLYLGYRAPPTLLSSPSRVPGRSAVGPILVAGLFFDLWIFYTLGGVPWVLPEPWVALGILLTVSLGSLAYLSRELGPRPSEEELYWVAVGVLVPLLFWSVVADAIILGTAVVTFLMVLFLLRLRTRIRSRETTPLVPPGALLA